MTEKTIAYGAVCTWWDSKEKAGLTSGPTRLPCCPHCRDVLFEMPEEQWRESVRRHDVTHPGYAATVEWGRGRCCRDWPTLKRKYEQREEDEE